MAISDNISSTNLSIDLHLMMISIHYKSVDAIVNEYRVNQSKEGLLCYGIVIRIPQVRHRVSTKKMNLDYIAAARLPRFEHD